MSAAATILPALRDDLQLFPQEPDLLGRDTAAIYDPLRHSYFRLSGSALAMVSRWASGDADVLRHRLQAECQIEADSSDIEEVRKFLSDNNLLKGDETSAGDHAFAAARLKKRPVWRAILHGYLFFRIPLVRPAGLLIHLSPVFEFAFRRLFWVAVLVTALCGMFLASREWDVFVAAAHSQLSSSGIVTIAAVLVVLKAVHELGHAVAATRYGCRVSTMGVAFLILVPLLYTDTTDAWRIRDVRKRMRIAIAGVSAELAVAALAIFLWAFLPDGQARNFAFTIAVTAPLATLVINLNPCMRFDGYFVLMDYWRIENLQARSFALARWRMR